MGRLSQESITNKYIEHARNSLRINFKKTVQKRIPITEWLPRYSISLFLQDLLAGFTVGLTEIPQGIAYAAVAGLPLQYGLYSGFMGCFVYFVFGSCKDINVGPTAIMALMVQPHVSALGPDMAVLICFLSGIIIFVLGFLHLGFLVQFFSYPVIAGFTSAAALNIASSQVKSLLGISGKSDVFYEAWVSIFKNIRKTRLPDATLGILTILFLIGLKEVRVFGTLRRREGWSETRNFFGRVIFMTSLARNALAVLIGTIIAICMEDADGKHPFILTGEVKKGLPSIRLPPFETTFNGTHYDFHDMISQYGTVVVFCPLIAILEHVAIAKAFSKGRTLDATQELIALGLANIFGSFVGSMPVTGSFTRTAVNNSSGVRTTTGGIITGVMVLLALSFLTSAFYFIPKATLAAVIIVAMFYLFDFHAFVLLYKSKKLDLVPFLVTLFACLILGLEYGILVGIATNLSFVLYSSARPDIDIQREKYPSGDIFLITPRGGLHFTAAEYMRETILKDCNVEKSIIVIDSVYVNYIDATVAKSFDVLADELQMRNQSIIFWNYKQSFFDSCVGVDKNLAKYFKVGPLDEIVHHTSPEDIALTNISLEYSIQ